jgi:hypothetical protein
MPGWFGCFFASSFRIAAALSCLVKLLSSKSTELQLHVLRGLGPTTASDHLIRRAAMPKVGFPSELSAQQGSGRLR